MWRQGTPRSWHRGRLRRGRAGAVTLTTRTRARLRRPLQSLRQRAPPRHWPTAEAGKWVSAAGCGSAGPAVGRQRWLQRRRSGTFQEYDRAVGATLTWGCFACANMKVGREGDGGERMGTTPNAPRTTCQVPRQKNGRTTCCTPRVPKTIHLPHKMPRSQVKALRYALVLLVHDVLLGLDKVRLVDPHAALTKGHQPRLSTDRLNVCA